MDSHTASTQKGEEMGSRTADTQKGEGMGSRTASTQKGEGMGSLGTCTFCGDSDRVGRTTSNVSRPMAGHMRNWAHRNAQRVHVHREPMHSPFIPSARIHALAFRPSCETHAIAFRPSQINSIQSFNAPASAMTVTSL
jgi:hypothetical protein